MMDSSLPCTPVGPSPFDEHLAPDKPVSLDELVAPNEVPFDEPVFPTTANERLYKSVVLLHDTVKKLNDTIGPYYRAFIKDIAAELRKEQSHPKPNLVELCRTTSVMDASFKKALLSGSWVVAKKKINQCPCP